MVLSQTFRSLIHSRLELGMKGYARAHPRTDIVLFEPDHRDAEHVPGQHLQLVAAPRARRTRLPAHARDAALATHSRSARGWRATASRIDDVVLDDDPRRLIGRAARRGTRTARALRRLEETLADLEHARR